ncbi:MAG: carboxylating nicotinate-nucleotide diphosphorylase [Arenicellales bacterium]|nr:carboxylating nicotinate-nucleotide diphosphorylase [Arenicellales bacterium]
MKLPKDQIRDQVALALSEDIGPGDLTASLISESERVRAKLVCRDDAVACGRDWIDAVFAALDPSVRINWQYRDSENINAGNTWCVIEGSARAVLSGERTALNFAQLLAGTATATRALVRQLHGTNAQLLDTRKTVPGLRLAQKYAVQCGGGRNHRLGLYDGILIKENHIRAAGSIAAALTAAETHVETVDLIEVEVETLDELSQALGAGARRIMLDNFSITQMRAAVEHNRGQAKLEASGNVNAETIREIALTGVDFISCGAITKNVRAIDLSLQFDQLDQPST